VKLWLWAYSKAVLHEEGTRQSKTVPLRPGSKRERKMKGLGSHNPLGGHPPMIQGPHNSATLEVKSLIYRLLGDTYPNHSTNFHYCIYIAINFQYPYE
jgi:hypothetical protein